MTNSLGEIVIGRIPVLECLRARRRRVHALHILQNAKGLENIIDMACNLPIRECSRQELDRIAEGGTHQGVILYANPLPVLHIDDWLHAAVQPGIFTIILDEIADPHNFGAIVRSACAMGASSVIFGKHRSAPLSSAALKSAAGAMEYIPLVQVTNLVKEFATLKNAGFWIAGLDAKATKVLWEEDLTCKLALVVGSEGKGLRRLVREACDFLISIPVSESISSLNASISAAIALTECVRQRSSLHENLL